MILKSYIRHFITCTCLLHFTCLACHTSKEETKSSNEISQDDCKYINGTCKNVHECEGLVVRNRCTGGNELACCVEMEGNEDEKTMRRHLNKVEGYTHLEGYQPTNQSGVTISTGYDLGYGPNLDSCIEDPGLSNKLNTFKGIKSKDELIIRGLVATDLKITLNESNEIDRCLLAYNKRAIATCVDDQLQNRKTSVSDCAEAVLVSLVHWCGRAGLVQGMENKCASTNSNRKSLKDFCDNQGSDKDLKRALEELVDDHERNGANQWVINRVKAEMNFLKNCQPKNLECNKMFCKNGSICVKYRNDAFGGPVCKKPCQPNCRCLYFVLGEDGGPFCNP